MNGIRERIGNRKVVIAILLVGIVAFSIGYALIQTKTGLAVLTSPPPGIAGPFYVTVEAKIYGPRVDLAMIKSKMSGTYASDYTYVQWGTNPFYRIYVDNTLQEVYYGNMKNIMQMLSGYNFYIETLFKNTFNDMINVGALDLLSRLGILNHMGNLPGVFISVKEGAGESVALTIESSHWLAAIAEPHPYGGSGYWLEVSLNETTCIHIYNGVGFNASGSLAHLYYWNITASQNIGSNWHATLYFEDLLSLETTIGSEFLRVYYVANSPGTGFVSKEVSPSPFVGSTINVTVRFDPPSAQRLNITDLYPNTFTWGSVDVLLQKFKVGTSLEETAYVNVVPVPDGSNMKFTIYYNQAPNILQELLGDEYIYLTYSLRAPSVAGEYTLPAATMSYLIPEPQT